ncbi:hypothetical protein H8710_04565 [Clostridiaceae bacterium NSJ-33]|uniref:Uncharacterized protein n=1 Tax=Fumia xinanensis TaxID=2763659 RepID=A0A926E4F9_9FIRM|nr:hypothetical protein [Fumia xinanensis]
MINTAKWPEAGYDEAGNILHFPVDRYFDEGKRETMFLGEPVTKYHRTAHHLSGRASRKRL